MGTAVFVLSVRLSWIATVDWRPFRNPACSKSSRRSSTPRGVQARLTEA